MKKLLYILPLSLAMTIGTYHSGNGQTIEDIFKAVMGGSSNQKSTSNTANSGLSNNEITLGLKEALTIGTNNAANKLSKTYGFFDNQLVKIMMPEEAKTVERTLRQFGMGRIADDAILLMNRAAEDAVKKAAPIFVNAIKQITLNDALSILRGGDNAATLYLQRNTQQQLMAAFAPEVKNSIGKVGADRIWSQVFTAYNKVNFGQQKVNTDLTQYVTQKATEGMFKVIAEEEMKIRRNPVARTTEILRKVFGNK